MTHARSRIHAWGSIGRGTAPLPAVRRRLRACWLPAALWSTFALAAMLLGAAAAPAPADVIDQESASTIFAWRRCGGTGRSLFQSFTPRFTPLSGVELDVREVPAGGDLAHIRIRAGWTQGPIVADATAPVTAEGWVRFTFAEPVATDAGRNYLIEWVEPRSWWAFAPGDPYRRGEAYNCGEEILPEDDYNFRTFAPKQHVETRSWAEIKAILAGWGGR